MNHDLQNYVETDLYNELRWLLCAATEWRAYKEIVEDNRLRPDSDFPRHLQVYAMDSTFLHARSLYEFFTATKTTNPERMTWKDFGLKTGLKSDLYAHEPQEPQDLIKPLHGRVMHLNKTRDGYEEIKQKVFIIAQDVLQLWDEFSIKGEVRGYTTALNNARQKAVNDATETATRYAQWGFKPQFV